MNPMDSFRNHAHFPRSASKSEWGVTYIELILVGLIITLISSGIWAVYYSVVNTYHQEQRGALIQGEGERIIQLITHGGHHRGRRIYGLSANVPRADYPKVGYGLGFGDPHDYGIIFVLDQVDDKERFAKFYVDFDGPGRPTSNLYFKLFTPDDEGNPDENYSENDGKGVLITSNLLQRRTNEDETVYGNYDKTWFKAQRLPKDTVTGYYSGISVSFYLVDATQPLIYNHRLDRKLITPISDPVQRARYLGAVPYPRYFSTSIYFMNRE